MPEKTPEKKMVTYHCRLCAKPFEVEKGSRRALCPDCLVKRISKKEVKPERT